MAVGTELFLGFTGESVMKEIMASLDLGVSEYLGFKDEDEPKIEALDAKMKVAHKNALEEMGLVVYERADIQQGDNPVEDCGHVFVEGLDGVIRETSAWRLAIEYDPDEMGDRPQDLVIGVSLISRYFPVFLDWMKESGGSGDVIEFTPELLKNVEIARKHLVPIIPFITDAHIIVKEIHY